MANFNSNARDLTDAQRLDMNPRDSWDPYEHPQIGLKAAIRNLGRDVRVEPRAGATPSPEIPEIGESAEPERTSDVTHKSSTHAGGGAVYTLEIAMVCPHCRTSIQTVRVSRLMRTQVSFTSTLPRKGYVIACPECERVLSAELSGMI